MLQNLHAIGVGELSSINQNLKPIAHQDTYKIRRSPLQSSYCFPIGNVQRYIWEAHISIENKTDVWQGTLVLMVLKTLETMGPLHGYGIARRIEQTSGNLLLLNYGTLYPALLKLEQEGSIASEWGFSENNRKAKFYRLTRAGRKQLQREERDWAQATTILGRFLATKEDPA
jgi:PadR family transcriptional regulator PadR